MARFFRWKSYFNHPFYLLLYLEWILLGIAVLATFTPPPHVPHVPPPQPPHGLGMPPPLPECRHLPDIPAGLFLEFWPVLPVWG